MLRFLLLAFLTMMMATDDPAPAFAQGEHISLPRPTTDGSVTVESALQSRRSIREYGAAPVSLVELSQLLWAAQGITGSSGKRTAPSAGALYPLEIYVVAGAIESLSAGIYRYKPRTHELVRFAEGDRRLALSAAAHGQSLLNDAAAVIVLAAVYRRTTAKYGDRSRRYVHMEVGHAAQNVYLQAESLKLGTTIVGAFHDNKVKEVLGLGKDETPLALMSVGRRQP